jgi:dynein heavy chain
MTKEMAAMTIRTFDEIGNKLSRTPIKFHYIFNMRDINKVYEGVMQSTIDKFETTKDFVRLWRHEMHKVI